MNTIAKPATWSQTAQLGWKVFKGYIFSNSQAKKAKENYDTAIKRLEPVKTFNAMTKVSRSGKINSNIKNWAHTSSNEIIDEYIRRSEIRAKCKEVTANQKKEQTKDKDFYKHYIKKEDTMLNEFRLRQVYWNYFRIGQHKLLKEGLKLRQQIQ